ncbi:MAG TPA: CAP domain-containing protein [Gaiellaceae bacterium]|nr:CAP domain-containing protein [Gaiellaceae bacterium]
MIRLGRKLSAVLVLAVAVMVVAAPSSQSSTSRSGARLTSLETSLLQDLNQVRAQYGLAALRSSPLLVASASQHTHEMGVDGYFEHSSHDGTSFSARISHWYAPAKHEWSVGENMLWYSPSVGARAAVSLWMGSPSHRANILNPAWREIGISAIHFPSAGGVYRGLPVTIITTDFGVRH